MAVRNWEAFRRGVVTCLINPKAIFSCWRSIRTSSGPTLGRSHPSRCHGGDDGRNAARIYGGLVLVFVNDGGYIIPAFYKLKFSMFKGLHCAGQASSREPVFHLIGEQPPSKIMIGFKGASLLRLPHADGPRYHLTGDRLAAPKK